MGIEKVGIYYNVIDEMEKCEDAEIDGGHVMKCIYANRFNAVTAHYQLLIKKKLIIGEPLLQKKLN